MNEIFRDALDYRSYRLANTKQTYGCKVAKQISKMAKRLEVQMRPNMSDATDPISILSFLSMFQAACDTNGISEGAEMWLFPFFVQKPANTAMTARLSLVKKSHKRRSEEKLTSYCAVVNHILGEYASDGIIAETVHDIANTRQPSGSTTGDYVHILWAKALRCGRVYNEARLKSIFVEGVDLSLRHSLRAY